MTTLDIIGTMLVIAVVAFIAGFKYGKAVIADVKAEAVKEASKI